jgi:PAS domain S-box-containing protein
MMITIYSILPLLQVHSEDQTLQFLPIILITVIAVLFLLAIILSYIISRQVRIVTRQSSHINEIMQQALINGENNVLYYNISEDWSYKLYGHLVPGEGFSTENWKKHVHPEDLPYALDCLHKLIKGEKKAMKFNYRWNSNYEGGEPQWRYLRNISVGEYLPGFKRPVGIISTLSDETNIVMKQEREKEMTDRYQIIFENSIIGLSFYTPEGKLLDANKAMRRICNFDSEEGDAFFSNANLFDMPPFNEVVNKNDIQEVWMCSKSEIPERNMNYYLEIRLHPIYNEEGKIVYVAIATRDITEEREMYHRSKLNDIQIQKANEEIQRYETELKYMMEACDMRAWRISYKKGTIQFLKGLSEIEKEMTVEECANLFLGDEEEFKMKLAHPEIHFNTPFTVLHKMRPIFHNTAEGQWNQINSVPIYDKDGKFDGCFGLIRNMTRFIMAQEKLKQETQRANESGRLKSVFLANMTHEIRTPLNAIVGFSDLLQMMTTTEEKRELIHVIHNNCDMLLRLINDIMAISAMDANGLTMNPIDTDFAKAFNEMCQTLAQRVENPNVQFIKENPYQTLQTHLDVGRMTQVMTNFVTNAVKYTQNGHIKVGYRLQDSGIYMYCEDTGTGIPKEQCAKVFERFVKLNDYVQGTGLGLSICKAIAERCNGKIGVDSEVGQGSTFWIWIPCVIDQIEAIGE